MGEYLDKLAILQIKQRRITDPARRDEVVKELEVLRGACAMPFPEVEELVRVNESLWECNERRKSLLRAGAREDPLYLGLTVEESMLNDERFRIKDRINRRYGSALKEQKSYPWL